MSPDQRVTVADIDMPFWSMVRFMLKWAVATEPALLVLMLTGMFLVNVLAGLLR